MDCLFFISQNKKKLKIFLHIKIKSILFWRIIMQTKRKRDHNGESVVHSFLCKYFYELFPKCETIINKKEQIAGIDEKCMIDGEWVSIDEKTQLTRLDQDITPYTTQCIELMSKNRNGVYNKGWINNTLTDCYLFTYIINCKTKDPEKLVDSNQIEKMRAVLISKKNIQKMFEENGFSLKDLNQDAYALLNGTFHRETGTHQYFDLNKNMWLCLSKANWLAETPVNAIIRWFLYEDYAWHVYNITPSYIEIIK